ncbi:lachrymatory-factor synthase-like [Aristolochia californica]|uniref:lachrymatory-factor synthase-like n=1 Tax=Aristolochia californica TaxID=171875 RepID=UPI0035DE94CE
MENGKQQPPRKWEGRSSSQLRGASPDKVWSLLEDFISVHKWLSTVDTCYLVQGERSKIGCVRYCGGVGIPSADGATVAWATEKLTAIDPVQRTLSYEIVDNNLGLAEYAARLKVLPDFEGSCTIEWSFVCDPADTLSEDQFKSFIDLSVQTMAKRMEAELQASE